MNHLPAVGDLDLGDNTVTVGDEVAQVAAPGAGIGAVQPDEVLRTVDALTRLRPVCDECVVQQRSGLLEAAFVEQPPECGHGGSWVHCVSPIMFRAAIRSVVQHSMPEN